MVILTSSSNKKITFIKKYLGEKNVSTINYKEIPEWGKKAKEISDDGKGVDHLLDVGGAKTLKQSLEAIAFNGSVNAIGFLARNKKDDESSSIGDNDTSMYALKKNVTLRGIQVGSVEQFNEMTRAIDMHQIKPLIDKVFKFEDLKSAYEHQWSQQHVGKVVIKIAPN
ncbi:unnamed protein product [Adineta steineri]|uniref:Alcohol dehydrogenase n=1 Tax=Adineta steineri TaxID=433720 RepID=A0A814F205_9BILA|nr:unnamed protein product [Adineta steineri]CAF3903146.1 unnamed protein product [Adineta steineri]